MTDDVPMQDLDDAFRGCLVARKETDAHLNNQGATLTREWILKLSDLLTTEHVWQEQYNNKLKFGGVGKFPKSRR